MPYKTINQAQIYYESHSSGGETILFSHGFLFNGKMFQDQVAHLKTQYRCVTYDHRGHGQSTVTQTGYDIDNLTSDAVGLIEKLGIAPCHFVGLSTGGFVGQRIAIRHPHLLKSLSLMETSPEAEDPQKRGKYRLLGFVARWFGLRLVAGQTMPILFGHKFINDPARTEQKQAYREQIITNHRLGVYRFLAGIMARPGIADQLGQIPVPTLILVGDQDVVYPPPVAEAMQARIPNAQLVVIPGAGHSASIEEPTAVNTALSEFLCGLAN